MTGEVRTRVRQYFSPAPHPIGVPTGVSTGAMFLRLLPLLLGQGGYEFAAEVGDVGYHAAPD